MRRIATSVLVVFIFLKALSQSSLPLYFGLGGAGPVEEILVRWPSGVEQRLQGPVEANQQIEITEPDA